MTPLQYRLTQLAKESAALSQLALKASLYGLEYGPDDNKDDYQALLHRQYNDVIGCAESLNDWIDPVDELTREEQIVEEKIYHLKAYELQCMAIGTVFDD